MPEISKIKLPTGTVYDLKDTVARATLSGAIKIKGSTTTALTDESTTNPIQIGGSSYTAIANDAVFYNKKEFVFDGTKWHEFGDMSGLGNMAYANTASGSVTAAGTIGEPGWVGTPVRLVTSGIDVPATYKFAGTSGTVNVSGTAAGNVSFTNENKTATVHKAESGEATYTPQGNITVPTISVKTAGATSTIKNPTSVTVAKTVTATAPGATAPTNPVTWCAIDGTDSECLNLYQLGYTTGASITTSNVTVKTGDAAYESTAPTFDGTPVRLVTDNISVPKSGTYSTTVASTGSFTPSGSVTTLTTSSKTAEVSPAASGEATYTPNGTITAPTWNPTPVNVTVTPNPIS